MIACHITTVLWPTPSPRLIHAWGVSAQDLELNRTKPRDSWGTVWWTMTALCLLEWYVILPGVCVGFGLMCFECVLLFCSNLVTAFARQMWRGQSVTSANQDTTICSPRIHLVARSVPATWMERLLGPLSVMLWWQVSVLVRKTWKREDATNAKTTSMDSALTISMVGRQPSRYSLSKHERERPPKWKKNQPLNWASFSSAYIAGCSACNCDPGGAYLLPCNKASGQCSCRNNIIGRQCSLSVLLQLIRLLHPLPQSFSCCALLFQPSWLVLLPWSAFHSCWIWEPTRQVGQNHAGVSWLRIRAPGSKRKAFSAHSMYPTHLEFPSEPPLSSRVRVPQS